MNNGQDARSTSTNMNNGQDAHSTAHLCNVAFFNKSILFALSMVKIITGLLKFKNYSCQKAKKSKVVVLIICG
ncbi:MAG: DUF1308 domain-containing protein [Okeania sp. SIO3I5]|uniref:hypothetical protein n=1 Tax=Okeania sp. SIO3I5 TaxID=2607805 RepID=UPI0013B75F72|nr:hypothetical protein [Okeania sp. SIO3I5]NEQ35287.1 DUF1308 domain-containing protein [Okeania sp. SIO3I5]